MIARVAALVVGFAAVAGAAGATIWARRRAQDRAARRRERRQAGRGLRPSGRRSAHAGVTTTSVATPADEGVAAEAGRPAPTLAATGDLAADGGSPGTGGLRSLKGVGAVSAERLLAIGVTSVAQVAAWSDEDIESVAARINVSPERIRREDWVGQARAAVKD